MSHAYKLGSMGASGGNPSVNALYREIGRAIQKLRGQRKPRMSQQALAEAIGISRASIANIERGHHRVQLHVLYDIATTLDIEPHDLMPHSDRAYRTTHLPDDVKRGLNPRERAAVDRLLRSGLTKESTNEKS